MTEHNDRHSTPLRRPVARAAGMLAALLLAVLPQGLHAQFKRDAFSQGYQNADTLGRDTTDKLFSFKDYFQMMSHKKAGKAGTLFVGSMVIPGGQQIYNGDKWKLPIVWGGLAGTLGSGIYYRVHYNSTQDQRDLDRSKWLFIGAGAVYWGMLMDGVVNFPTDNPHDPGKATLYSVLLPGLGQAYNGEYWKIPIYYALMAGSVHFAVVHNRNYLRYKWIHNEATTPDSGYDGPVSGETAKYYRDIFRRYRDYSIVAIAASYLLQVIDANVFSYMQDFEIDDNITLRVAPTVLPPDNFLTMGATPSTGAGPGPGFGMSMQLTF